MPWQVGLAPMAGKTHQMTLAEVRFLSLEGCQAPNILINIVWHVNQASLQAPWVFGGY